MSTLASVEDAKVPLLEDCASLVPSKDGEDDQDQDLARRVWIESKKLWHIVGPAIFSRLASYSMLIITQAFAGHLGDLELAAISIANNVIVGFDLGLLVLLDFSLAIFHFSKTERRRRQALYLHCL
jgi:MATE family multidrug resistance protein